MSITQRSGAGCSITALSWSSDCAGISSRKCCKFQMQTSLSPSACCAFLGCQIEKAVDELSLSKKIISCHPVWSK